MDRSGSMDRKNRMDGVGPKTNNRVHAGQSGGKARFEGFFKPVCMVSR